MRALPRFDLQDKDNDCGWYRPTYPAKEIKALGPNVLFKIKCPGLNWCMIIGCAQISGSHCVLIARGQSCSSDSNLQLMCCWHDDVLQSMLGLCGNSGRSVTSSRSSKYYRLTSDYTEKLLKWLLGGIKLKGTIMMTKDVLSCNHSGHRLNCSFSSLPVVIIQQHSILWL